MGNGASSPEEVISELKALLRDAGEKAYSLDYVCMLVRLEGITSERDPLLVLNDFAAGESEDDIASYCSSLKPAEHLLALIENLTRLVAGEPFDPFPFRELLPPAVQRRPEEQPIELGRLAATVAGHLDQLGKPNTASAIRSAYPSDTLEQCTDMSRRTASVPAVSACRQLIIEVLVCYEEELAAISKQQSLHRLPNFEVLELLSDGGRLRGFKMHFSNGNTARFERRDDGTDCVNVILDVPVGFMVGFAENLKEEWRVGDRLLHEIGLPGRYNDPGAWKPLIFPGDPDPIRVRVRETSDDPDVQGALFYIHCTGHWVLEFVAVMNAELPSEVMVAGDRVHIYKCNPSTEDGPRPAAFIYDGWVDLPDPSPETVAAALHDVARLMNRTALALDVPVSWRPKYSFRAHHSSTWLGDNVDDLNRIFAAYPTGPDEVAIDIAVDWYNRGATSSNPFTAFLCFYIGIESLANAISDGDATLGLEISMDQTTADERIAELRRMHDELFEDDPGQFVVNAYFEIIQSVTERTRALVRAVFGAGSREYELLFTKSEGVSLTDLRSKLAHGRWSELSVSEAREIRDRVWQVKAICRELILRIFLNLAPSDRLPGSSRATTMSFDDPWSIEVASSEAGFPTRDWSIRAEWVAWD